jgi:hypothetical protein
MPDNNIKMWWQVASPRSCEERPRALEVASKRVGFARGEDGYFGRPGSEAMHRDADEHPVVEVENEG